VAFGSLYLLRKLGRVQFARHRISLFAPDGFVQEHHRVFQLDQTRACLAHRLLGDGHFNFQRRGL
jgi:hypothetical protein